VTGGSERPRVSIVTAAYNRSQVLKHAVQSVLAQTFTDWELIVVGDGCTDDTEGCVAAFRDRRIHFENLPRNTGGQAAPNNRGIALARGDYLAFLNQDDLFLPHHLATCIAELDAGHADLVWVPALVAHEVEPGPDGAPPRGHFRLAGVSGKEEYTPFAFYCASSWVLRRETAMRIGPWPSESSVFVTPSQAWLFRAWRSGARLQFIPTVSVVLLYSGGRPGSYARRESPEHDVLTRWVREDPCALERMLEAAAVHGARTAVHAVRYRPLAAVLRGLARPLHALLAATGTHPSSLGLALRYRRRGGYVRRHRRFTGAG
jgi:glycosyltransferase involved in cell wall biosynthesis